MAGENRTGEFKRLPVTVSVLISGLRSKSGPEFSQSFDTFCDRYWHPVYCFIRAARSKRPEDATDLTQAFFLWLQEGDSLGSYRAEKGSFRVYFKTILRHFLATQEKFSKSLKRGGRAHRIPLDLEAGVLKSIPSDDPDRGFDAMWMSQVLDRAVESVRQQDEVKGRAVQFRAFEMYHLNDSAKPPKYRDIARDLGIRESEVRNHLVAVKARIRLAVKREIENDSEDPKALASEWEGIFDERKKR